MRKIGGSDAQKVQVSDSGPQVGGDAARGGGGVEELSEVLPGGDAKQRWARDKYNAYQREYMRRRRASK